jgi:hypothetical protein
MSLTHQWTNELLDEMRQQTDPFADRAAAALFGAVAGHSKEDVGAFITRFVSQDFSKSWQNQTAIPDPPELVDFFENFDDFQLTPQEIEYLQKGADFFAEHGPMITFALGVRSLLKQYAHTKAIEVLRLTTLLVKHVNRRILETMQFVLDVMTPGWEESRTDDQIKLNLHHPGLMSIKKLRLVHAMIRYRLHHKMYDVSLGDYDNAVLGQPINQEDMVFAVHTFSLEIIEGLREMHIPVTDEQAENYFQCWKIIGRALGVSRQLEPASYDDAIALQELIYQRHFTLPNTVGPILSTALMNWFVTAIPLLKEKLLITFIRDFNGPENFDLLRENLNIDLGNSHADLKEHLASDASFKAETGQASLAANDGEASLDRFFIEFIKTLITTERGGKNETFRVGDGFMAAWNLNRMSEKPMSKGKVFLLALTSLLERLTNFIKNLLGQSAKA